MGIKDKIKDFFWDFDEMFVTDEKAYNDLLENHELKDQIYYRLHYINYHNINRDPGRRGVIDCPYDAFYLPNGMSREDGFKVLSYLTDFIEKHPEVDEASWKSVSTLDTIIDIERFGFKRVGYKPFDEDVIDLFTVTGRINRFKKSKYYSKYYNWYIPNVTKDEVINIYDKCGLTFSDIVFDNSSELKKDNFEYEYIPEVNILRRKM